MKKNDKNDINNFKILFIKYSTELHYKMKNPGVLIAREFLKQALFANNKFQSKGFVSNYEIDEI